MTEAPVLPSWRFHITGEARIIATPDELTALTPGEWYESPQAAAQAAAQACAEETPPPRSRR